MLFFGQLVHQTIERIHCRALDGQLDTLTDQKLRVMFERTYTSLLRTNICSITSTEKELAFHQVLSYFQYNQHEMQGIQAAELAIRIEQDDYILTCKIDLLMSGEKGLEILNFKTHPKSEEGSARLTFYKQQLYLYAYALYRHMGQFPQRLLLYWTAEEQKEEVPYHEDDVKQVIRSVQETITKIRQHQFEVKVPPHPKICKTCDVRHLCRQEGII